MLKKNEKNEYCFPNYETEQIKEAFDIFDINRNGYIGVDELKEIFTIINEDVTEEELDEMIGLADKEGDGQVNWLNFYEFISGNGITDEIKKMKRMDDVEENENDEDKDVKKSNQKFKLIGENNNYHSNDNSISVKDSINNYSNVDSKNNSYVKSKNLEDDDNKRKKVSHFRERDNNSFNDSNDSNNNNNTNSNFNYNTKSNFNYNTKSNFNYDDNENIFDEVDDEEKKKDDEKTNNFIAEMLKKKEQNNLENNINFIDGNDFERRKPKQIKLKEVNLKKTYSLESKSEKDKKSINNLEMDINSIKNKIFFKGNSFIDNKSNNQKSEKSKKSKEEEKDKEEDNEEDNKEDNEKKVKEEEKEEKDKKEENEEKDKEEDNEENNEEEENEENNEEEENEEKEQNKCKIDKKENKEEKDSGNETNNNDNKSNDDSSGNSNNYNNDNNNDKDNDNDNNIKESNIDISELNKMKTSFENIPENSREEIEESMNKSDQKTIPLSSNRNKNNNNNNNNGNSNSNSDNNNNNTNNIISEKISNSNLNKNQIPYKKEIISRKTDAFLGDLINEKQEPIIRIESNHRLNSFKSLNDIPKNNENEEINISQVSKVDVLNKSKSKDININIIPEKIIIKKTSSINSKENKNSENTSNNKNNSNSSKEKNSMISIGNKKQPSLISFEHPLINKIYNENTSSQNNSNSNNIKEKVDSDKNSYEKNISEKSKISSNEFSDKKSSEKNDKVSDKNLSEKDKFSKNKISDKISIKDDIGLNQDDIITQRSKKLDEENINNSNKNSIIKSNKSSSNKSNSNSNKNSFVENINNSKIKNGNSNSIIKETLSNKTTERKIENDIENENENEEQEESINENNISAKKSIYNNENNNNINSKEEEEDEDEKIEITKQNITNILNKKDNKVTSMIHKNAFKLDKVIEEDDMIKSKKSENFEIKRANAYQKGDSTIISKNKINKLLFQKEKNNSNNNIFPDDVEITKVNANTYQKFKGKISKKDTIKNLIEIEKITPDIIKKFYENCKNNLRDNITYQEMISTFLFSKTEESKIFFDTFKLIDIQQNEEDKINVGDVLILLLNGTKLFYEEKFKFEFLVLNVDQSNYLSKNELIHLLELNFMTYVTNEISKRFKLIVKEVKSMGLVDEEAFDYDILLDVLKKKPFLFFPYNN